MRRIITLALILSGCDAPADETPPTPCQQIVACAVELDPVPLPRMSYDDSERIYYGDDLCTDAVVVDLGLTWSTSKTIVEYTESQIWSAGTLLRCMGLYGDATGCDMDLAEAHCAAPSFLNEAGEEVEVWPLE
jgi:hypothetical protein